MIIYDYLWLFVVIISNLCLFICDYLSLYQIYVCLFVIICDYSVIILCLLIIICNYKNDYLWLFVIINNNCLRLFVIICDYFVIICDYLLLFCDYCDYFYYDMLV